MLRGEPAFEAALAGSHNAVVRCEAYIAGRRVASDVPLVDGTVTADSDSFVRRTANLVFVEDTTSAAEALGKTLARPGCEIRVWRGVRIGNATRVLPIHWGRVQRPRWEWPNRRITLTSPDLAIKVAPFRG